MSAAVWTIILLVVSNVFMTFAWYGHLKLQATGVSSNWPLFVVILFSWAIAFLNIVVKFRLIELDLMETGAHFH